MGGSHHFENNSHISTCLECNGSIIYDTFHRETICENCGLVYSENPLDLTGFEYNAYTYEEKKKKARGKFVDTLFYPHIHYETKIDLKNTSRNFRRIANLDTHFTESTSRNLVIAIPLLKQISANLQLSYPIKATTMYVYKKALKKDLIQGRSIKGVLAACFYYSCRLFHYPLSIQELSNELFITEKELKKYYITLSKELSLKVPTLDPGIYLSKYIHNLNLDISIEKQALEVLQKLPFNFLNGKEPKSLLGAIIYYICKKENIKITQMKLTELTGTCEVSIRHKYKNIQKFFSK